MLSRASLTSLVLLGTLAFPACGGDDSADSGGTESESGDGDSAGDGDEGMSAEDTSGSTGGDGDGDSGGDGDGGDGDGGDGDGGTTGGGTGDKAYFLMDEINVRDQHFITELIPGTCGDVTDLASIGVNAMLNDSIQMDMNDPPDGILDLSLLFSLDPWDSTAANGDTEAGLGFCSAPFDSTECAWPMAGPAQTSSFDNMDTGTCLAADPADLGGYDPAPNTVIGSCFAATLGTFDITLAGVTLPLVDVTLAGHYNDDVIDNGLLKGFLTETAADAAILPDSVAQFGGSPVSDLLLGGAGNACPNKGDDRDMNNGESGWWFYVDFTAMDVPLTFTPPAP